MFSRKFTIVAITLALSSTAAFSKGGQGHGPGPGQNQPPFPAEYDTNGDGKVSRSEVKAARTAEFTAIDANADTYLSFQELQTWMGQKQTERFNTLDTDQGGSLSQDEFVAGAPGDGSEQAAKVFSLADTSGDGALSAAEFQALEPVFPQAVRTFVSMDQDDDNQISEDEYLAPPRQKQGSRPGPF
jgi:Ca2+-binding EF-hand superfamily protein